MYTQNTLNSSTRVECKELDYPEIVAFHPKGGGLVTKEAPQAKSQISEL